MSGTFPARPGTALDGTTLTGALIQNLNVDNGKFYLKVTSATFNGSMPLVETTGSGDATVKYSHGDKPYYDITLQGVMLAGRAVGLQNLTQQINATGGPEVTLDFKFSGETAHQFTAMPVIVTQCQIQYDPKLPVVGVALSLKSMLAADKGLSGALSS